MDGFIREVIRLVSLSEVSFKEVECVVARKYDDPVVHQMWHAMGMSLGYYTWTWKQYSNWAYCFKVFQAECHDRHWNVDYTTIYPAILSVLQQLHHERVLQDVGKYMNERDDPVFQANALRKQWQESQMKVAEELGALTASLKESVAIVHSILEKKMPSPPPTETHSEIPFMLLAAIIVCMYIGLMAHFNFFMK